MKESIIIREKGITLIALAVTIIILLILAGVAINAVTGENGLFRKAKESVNVYKDSERNETSQFEYLDKEWSNITGSSNTKEELITFIVEGVQYKVKAGTTWSEYINNTPECTWMAGYDPKKDPVEEGYYEGNIWVWDYQFITIDWHNWTDNRGAFWTRLIGPDGKLVVGSNEIAAYEYDSIDGCENGLYELLKKYPDLTVRRYRI